MIFSSKIEKRVGNQVLSQMRKRTITSGVAWDRRSALLSLAVSWRAASKGSVPLLDFW